MRTIARIIRFVGAAAFPAACVMLAAPAWGQVVVDNSFGHAGALTGPNYQVPASLGQSVGTNVFQSFSQFNLSTGQSATFTAPNGILNILARVTGGSVSNINGTITTQQLSSTGTTGSGRPPAFFLINPAGVVFGPNASLNVGGSFVVTTANVVKLADGGSFAASANPGDSVLTTAAPAAFGFLTPKPVGVTITGANLAVPPGQVLSVVAGPIQIQGGATLSAPAGRVNLVAAGSVGDATLDATTAGAPAPSVTYPTRADITMTGGSQILTIGDPAGAVDVSAANLSLSQPSSTQSTGIFAVETGDLAGQGINLDLTGTLTLTGGSVISAQNQGSGSGGNIVVSAAGLSLTDGAQITASTTGSGTGGNITVNSTGNVTIDSGDTVGAAAATGIIDQTTQTSIGGGQAGNITLMMPGAALDVLRGGSIDASSLGSGAAGNITIAAGAVDLDRLNFDRLNRAVAKSDQINTGILAASYAAYPSPAGNAGNVVLDASGNVDIRHGDQIAVYSQGVANAGGVNLSAANLNIEGRSAQFISGIKALAFGAQAGNVNIDVTHTVYVDVGTSSSLQPAAISTFGDNNGANILINVGTALILIDSRINAQAGLGGGRITVNAGEGAARAPLVVLSDSVITSVSGEANDIIQIAPGAVLVESSDSRIRASHESTPTPVDITSILVTLPDTFLGTPPRLDPSCTILEDISTFTNTGRGGRPLDVSGWQPSLDLSPVNTLPPQTAPQTR